MGQITIECDTGKVSDGYHTFDELYEHRCLLFIGLIRAHPEISWRSRNHADGSAEEGWFIAGMNLPSGQISYHLPIELWPLLNDAKIKTLNNAPEWDGHTQRDVITRLRSWYASEQREAE